MESRDQAARLAAANDAAQRERQRADALERRVSELVRELDAFTHSVSHDLRAPLRAIQGFTHVTLEQCADALPEEGRDYLRRVSASARRMSSLMDDLILLSKVERAPLQPAPVDVTALARSVWNTFVRAPEQETAALSVTDGLRAVADRRLLRIVLEQLLDNARKFSAQATAPQIEVGAHDADADGDTAFFVRDNGAGFNQAYVGRLFTPFQRLHSDAEFPGNGAGLAMVHRIVRRHGGRVWAEGAVGSGATVSFTLPAAAAAR